MLEEQNDNLQNADGNLESISTNEITTNDSSKVVNEEEKIILEVTQTTDEQPDTKQLLGSNETQNNIAIQAIAEVNAEESEDESLKDRHEIPMLDYEAMSMEDLVTELEKLVVFEKIMSVKDHVEEIKTAFLSKYNHFIDEKKDEFEADRIDINEEFHYHFPLKNKFDQLYSNYRDKKNIHFKSLQNNLKTNLENRLAIVEELKNLLNSPENISNSLKQLNELRERWKNAGPIPKDKYNHVWNNYHFHIENFYDFYI